MVRWTIKEKANKKNGLAEVILKNRGLSDSQIEEFIKPSYDRGLGDPFLLPDMKIAVTKILEAAQQKQRVAIYGDYDIDGITAATVLLKTFKYIGLDSEIYIPDRFEEGYGLNEMALLSLKAKDVDLVVSVDCGSSAAIQIENAAAAGLPIIVTDHHNLTAELPRSALAHVNPKRLDSKYPTEELAGVGVAFALVRAIVSQAPELFPTGWEKWLLDLVALGTICDVVSLTGENRLLAKYGLLVLAKTRNIGLRTLMSVSGVEQHSVTSADLGFRLGPRLNAAGRIEHAGIAIDLLNTDDEKSAKVLAEKLNHLNLKRREQTDMIVAQATAAATKYKQDKIIVLADSAWSHGVVGIAASRISEIFSKPTILMQIEGELTKGSARSVVGFSIINALHEAKGILQKYGGHDFAAGLTVRTEDTNKLRETLNKYAENKHFEQNIKLKIDLEVDPAIVNIETLDDIDRLSPFGRDNDQPVLASGLKLKSFRFVGQDQNHMRLTFEHRNSDLVGIVFSHRQRWPWLVDSINQPLDVAYRLIKNEWNGRVSPQLEIVDLRRVDEQ